ncbi:tail fiber domain-containing protein [Roseisolibacter sp. H3M3-2]|uniref:tail fiber domain-containing protein n=1 Tax=Roseisolibacter sp. H3M3-2 TaxID=3031323 RepID=UPI0023DC2B13|nr:tail fiber domain-containing protein [Roseisolibacter sp. H3M3-2]MDF1504931.1 tail fiber domain-containing protein [Roseisolibacter sp. H3M3-2]
MPRSLRTAALTALASALPLLIAAAPAGAQSDILMRLRSGSPAGDRFRVDSAGGLIAMGEIGRGIIPASGPGWRMMWYPYKVAFRAGYADGGNQMDDAKIGFYSWAGGALSVASGIHSFAMGDGAVASGPSSVALGSKTEATGGAAVAIGLANRAVQTGALALGHLTVADGDAATALGYRSTASADYSTAIGYRAATRGRVGAIVIADASTTDSLEATANNQFTLRAAGGVRLFTNATKTTGVTVAPGGSSWSVVSDSTRKEAFAEVDGEAVLAKLRDVPVTSWRYRDEEDRATRHIGPMAQDWHRAFGFNTDDRTINMSDFDGVNLAAVRALEARTAQLQAKAAEVDALREEVRALRDGQRALERRLAKLEGAR